MLNALAFPVSACLGFLSGLGVGGGSLLILWLNFVMDMSPGDARFLNLLFFIPGALTATLFRYKKSRLPLRKAAPAAVIACVFAAGFSLLIGQTDTAILKKLFGILLLITGIREVCYRERKAR